MRRLIAAVLVVALLLAVWTPVVHAGTSTDIALGLASFAVFNQVVAPLIRPRHAEGGWHRRQVVHTVVTRPAVVYPAPVYAAPVPLPPAPAPQPAVVQYPHGRYELRLHGAQYVWVWLPAVPPPPPPPPLQ
jgi:hypothetical protein